MDETLAYTAANRRSWNVIAAERPPEPASFFAAGGSTLDTIETDLLPDVNGRRLLHLACASGNDTLSWAAHGADVVGVDITSVAIDLARQTAAAAGLPARFVTADMFALPADLGDFDIVYASWGVVCWVPDLPRWLTIVAGLLRPGGVFALFEHHPLWEVLGVRGTTTVEVTADYFGRGRPTPIPLDQAKRPSGSTPDTPLMSFVWPVSDVVEAVRHAGLRLDTFTEQSVPEMWTGLGPAAAGHLPSTYAVLATKPQR